MAGNKKISALTNATPDVNDSFPIYQASSGSTKRAQISNLSSVLFGQSDVVDTDQLLDDSVTGDKIDSTTFNPFVVIGKTTLGSAASSISCSWSGTYTALKVILVGASSGGAISSLNLGVNNDSTNGHYARRVSVSGGSDSSATVATSFIGSGTVTNGFIVEGEICNIATVEKVGVFHLSSGNTAGANSPTREEWASKWIDTSNSITSMQATTSSNNFAAGTTLIVMGMFG